MIKASFGLSPRDRDEHHRVATQLELFFDLASVVAIATAAHGLAHAIAANHAMDGLFAFTFSFFAIWWAWMNYTWFASAYDDAQPLFRIITMLIIVGALIMAAGISELFENRPILFVWFGFVVMRLGQITLWLMAARGDRHHRTTALRYAFGIVVAQLYWTFVFWGPEPGSTLFKVTFALGMVIELAVPAFAERANTTPWHRHHIIERYGLLNIIVLGEIMLAIVTALRKSAGDITLMNPLLHVAICAAVITFSLWWAYFSREEHLQTQELRRVLMWGYGHVIVFAAAAALGAGFIVLIDVLTAHAQVGVRTGDIAVAIPLALYLIGLWFIRDRYLGGGLRRHTLLVGAVALLVAGFFLPAPLELMTAITVLSVIVRTRSTLS